MKIDTLEKFGEYSIKELTDLLNEEAAKVKCEDTNASYVKECVENKLSSLFGGKFEVRSGYVDSRSITITHPNMFFSMEFKLSAKNTDKIKKITKLKSSYVKVPGKVSFDNISFGFDMPCYKYDEKTKRGSIDSEWTTSGEDVYLKSKELDMSKKLKEINSEEFFMYYVEKSAIDENGSLENYIISSAFQPWIKRLFMEKREKIEKELAPYATKYNIDKSDDNWPWHASMKAYEENNPDIVQKTIDWILSDAFGKNAVLSEND